LIDEPLNLLPGYDVPMNLDIDAQCWHHWGGGAESAGRPASWHSPRPGIVLAVRNR